MIRERWKELIKNDQSGRREGVGGEKRECEPAKRTAKQSRAEQIDVSLLTGCRRQTGACVRHSQAARQSSKQVAAAHGMALLAKQLAPIYHFYKLFTSSQFVIIAFSHYMLYTCIASHWQVTLIPQRISQAISRFPEILE